MISPRHDFPQKSFFLKKKKKTISRIFNRTAVNVENEFSKRLMKQRTTACQLAHRKLSQSAVGNMCGQCVHKIFHQSHCVLLDLFAESRAYCSRRLLSSRTGEGIWMIISVVTRSFSSTNRRCCVSAAFYERELVISPSRAHLPTWLPRTQRSRLVPAAILESRM